MKIRFTKDVELELFESAKFPVVVIDKFKSGTKSEIDICDDMQPPFAREIQFGDGSVAFVTEDFWKCVDIDISTL